jgi:hypothetical protein
MLFFAGNLDERVGGPPQDLSDLNNKKRTVYGRVSRNAANRLLLLFDFPDPNISGDQRSVTNVPLQGLFFMNSDLVWREAGLFANRVAGDQPSSEAERIAVAYRILYGRKPTEVETQRGLKFLDEAGQESGSKLAWQQYAQVLLSSGETNYIN